MPDHSAPKVLLVGWSGADWRWTKPLLESGQMPALEGLVNRGVMGEMATLVPTISPMLWTSVATGSRPFEHGVHGALMPEEGAHGIRPTWSSDWKQKALWQILGENGLKSNVVGWPATHPAQEIAGVIVSEAFARPTSAQLKPWPFLNRSIAPSRVCGALREMHVSPEEIGADVLSLFVSKLGGIDQTRDRSLAKLAIHLAEAFSIQAAVTWLMEHEPWDFTAVHFPTIEYICRDFMCYHPPRSESISERMFEIYQDVVSSAYRLHDLMLARLLQLAGPETTVMLVSGHGYTKRVPLSQDSPAARTVEWENFHRPRGMFVMGGPLIRRDELAFRAHLLQVAPTVLALFGLTAPQFEAGRIEEAFMECPPIQSRPQPPPDCPEIGLINPATHPVPPEEATLLLARTLETDRPGLIGDPAADFVTVRRQNIWNLARSYLDADRFGEALPLLEEVYHEFPENIEYAEILARCQIRLGQVDAAEESLEAVFVTLGDSPVTRLLRANLCYERGDFVGAVEQLRGTDPSGFGVRQGDFERLRGHALGRLGQWPEAEASFQRAVESDPEDALSHLGRAHASLRLEKFSDAVESAREAIRLRYALPAAHFVLGMGLCRMGEWLDGIAALENARRLHPAFPHVNRILERLYSRLQSASSHKADLTAVTELQT
jgi:predicted AlkP superfamily phosphohydrolase/phosphomutase/Tfp pilus assembly protein PilF